MKCKSCNSENIKLLKEGSYTTGSVCLECGFGNVDYNSNGCCGNSNHIHIQFEQSNGTIVQRVACKSCKSLIGGAVKKDKWFESYPKLSNIKYKQIEQEKSDSHRKLSAQILLIRDNIIEAKNDLWWQNYNKYLLTTKWKDKRIAVLKRENDMCQGCHSKKAQHVHHTTYSNLGDELLFQLVALCIDCHSKLHPEKQIS
jgi:hypothetical protein